MVSEEELQNFTSDEDNLSVRSSTDLYKLNFDHFMFNDNSAIIHVSMEAPSLGRIIKVNNATCNLFGWKKMAIEGSSINTLMPNIISMHHDQLLRNFTIINRSYIQNSQINTFALHKDNHIIPITIYFKTIVTKNGNFEGLGLIKEMLSRNESRHII